MSEAPVHLRMTRWYDLPRLISIGLRVAISTVFGQFADRREALAAGGEIDPRSFDPSYSYRETSPEESFCFDFVADAGDGWNPTYAVARLLAEPVLSVDGQRLPASRVLVMGGDQVYPTASRDAYQRRLIAPYLQASADAHNETKAEPRVDLYAIPGNHDWYDGLRAFLGVFCGRRVKSAFAGAAPGRAYGIWQTRQTRSYFALALPHGWWLWGVDIQLEGYIDRPQIDFFDHVAREWMEPNSNLIICTGQPEWAYLDGGKMVGPRFRNFSYLASVAVRAGRNHNLRLVLSGDSHHYARYIERQPELSDVHYVTAGGGGAFLHPTHTLGNKSVDSEYPAPGRAGPKAAYSLTFNLAAAYPSAATSRKLAWRNLMFAALNWGYTFSLAVICAFFAWLLNANALSYTQETLAETLLKPVMFAEAIRSYLTLVFISPWPMLLVAMATAGYCYFADFQSTSRRIGMGLLHAAAQTFIVVLATITIARWLPDRAPAWSLIVLVGLAGGLLAATVMGIYLLVCVLLLERHTNEAFSSLRIQDYKNFLRIEIVSRDKLKVYPIGISAVDSSGRDRSQPHLIEEAFEV